MQQAAYLHNNPLKAIKMKQLERILAEKLLKISAIKLQPEIPFVWASGWNSPIYTDNRKTLSYPEIRNFIKVELTRLIMENFSDAEVVAGVATGAIAQGALVADTMGVPYIYVRSSPKDHGLENLIEGNLKSGQKVVVIEDLISTGGSSLKHRDIFSMRLSRMSGKRSNTGAVMSRTCSSSISSFKSTETQPSLGVTCTCPLSLIEKYLSPHPLML